MAKWYERTGRAIGGVGNNVLGLASGGLLGNENYGFIDDLGRAAGLNDAPIIGGLFGESTTEKNMREADQAMQQGISQARGDIKNLYGTAKDSYMPYIGMAQELPGLQQRVAQGDYTGNIREAQMGPQYQQFQPGLAQQYSASGIGQNGPQYQQYNPQQVSVQAGQGYQQYTPAETKWKDTYSTPEMERFNFNFSEDPGYQYAKEQGQKDVMSSMASRGLAVSGAEMKALAKHSTGMAAQQYGDAANRALAQYGAEQNSRLGLANLAQGGYQFGAKLGTGLSEANIGRQQQQNQFGQNFNQQGSQFDRGLNFQGAQNYQNNMLNQNQFGQNYNQRGYQFGAGLAQQDIQNIRGLNQNSQINQLNNQQQENQFGQTYNQNAFNDYQNLGLRGDIARSQNMQNQFSNEYNMGNMGMNAINQRAGLMQNQAGLYGDLAIGQGQARADRLMAQAAQRQQGISGMMQLGGQLGAGYLMRP